MMNNKRKNSTSDKKGQTDSLFNIQNFVLREGSLSRNLIRQRKKALAQFWKLPDPSKKDELWRKSRIDQFYAKKHELLPNKNVPRIERITGIGSTSNKYGFAGSILITPEKITTMVDEELMKSGVVLTDLRTAEKKYPNIIEKIMGKVATSRDNKFSKLSMAFPQFGTILYLPQGIKVEKPIQTNFLWSGSGFLHTYYSLILLESNSSVTVIQTFEGKGLRKSENAFSRVMEIQIGQNASLNYTEINAFDKFWWNFADEHVKVMRGGNINWAVLNNGSYYSKTFLGLDLSGKESKAKVTGVIIPSGKSQIDFDTYQNHALAYTTSDLLFRNAMADSAHSNWSGMIKVGRDAIKADGYQAHQSLLLCGNPQVESNPGLEILTDDVKCSHGVTVGDINEDQVFYLKTRGIPSFKARQLIAEGFLESSLSRIEDRTSKRLFRERIQHELARLLCH